MSETISLVSIDNFIPKIAETLLDISDLAKCLKYDSSDALSLSISQNDINDLFNQDSSNENKRVFYQPFNNKTISDKRTELRIYYPIINAINSYLAGVTVGFDVVVHNDLWSLNDSVIRPIKIIKLILEKLNEKDIGGARPLILNGSCRLVYFNENFTGYQFYMNTSSR